MATSKWMESMSKKLGSEEAVREYMRELARKQKGSKKPKSGTGSLTKEQQSALGKKASHKRWGKTDAQTS